MKGYVFGDVGGHASSFFASLSSLGVNIETGEIPEGIHIVQVGDLIHQGPTVSGRDKLRDSEVM